MPTIVVPVFGELAKLGSGTAWAFDDDIASSAPTAYAFTGNSSFITDANRRRRRQYAYPLGSYAPVDILAGGNAQRDNPEAQWTYFLVPPEGYTGEQGAYWIERNINVLEALIRAPKIDGTSGELQTLAIKVRVNSTVGTSAAPTVTKQTATAPVALVNVDQGSPDSPFRRQLTLTFAIYDDFSY